MGLVLILIVFATLSAEAQITMSLRVSWRTEVSPLDTLRQPINVPYLHVVYRMTAIQTTILGAEGQA